MTLVVLLDELKVGRSFSGATKITVKHLGIKTHIFNLLSPISSLNGKISAKITKQQNK